MADLQLSRLLDGDLSLTSRQAIHAHLESCHACAQRHDELVSIVAALRTLPPAAQQSAPRLPTAPQPSRRTVVSSGSRALVMPASAGMALLAVAWLSTLPLVHFAVRLIETLLRTLDRLPLTPLPASSGAALITLLAALILAPLVAYPLSRRR